LTNRAAELRDIADEALINKLFVLEAGLRKDATLLEGALGGAADSLTKLIAEHIDMSSTGSMLASLFNIIAFPMLFRIHPALGVIALVANEYDIDMKSIWSSVVNAIKPSIMSGQQVSKEDINGIGKSLLTAEASDDFFEGLRKVAEDEGLIKNAQFFGNRSYSRTQPLGGSRRQ